VATDSGAQLVARQATRTALHNGDRVGIFVEAANAHRFDAQGRAARAG
jgi:multiple sugar transport system ATP-binding protein